MPERITNFDREQAERIEAPDTSEIKKALGAEIKGQDEAVEAWANIIHRVLSDAPKLRKGPFAVLTQIGPSGVGKTEIAIQAARYLASKSKKSQSIGLEDEKPSILRIDCGEYREKHEVSKVIGAPPGYTGYGDTPRLDQTEIDKHAIKIDEKRSVTILLMDEIEKAHPDLNVTFLGPLDYGIITLGNGKKTNLESCVVVFTSNLGNTEIRKKEDAGQTLDIKGQKDTRIKAMREHFTPEQLSRMGGETNTILFNQLSKEVATDILLAKLDKLEGEYKKHGRNIKFQITEAGLEHLFNLGYSTQQGARRMEIVLEQQIGFLLTNLKKTNTIIPVVIDVENNETALYIPKSAKDEKSAEQEEDGKGEDLRELLELIESNDPKVILESYYGLVKRMGAIAIPHHEATMRGAGYGKNYDASTLRKSVEKGYLTHDLQRNYLEALNAGVSPIKKESFTVAFGYYYRKMAEIIMENIKNSGRSDYEKRKDAEMIDYHYRNAINVSSPNELIKRFKKDTGLE